MKEFEFNLESSLAARLDAEDPLKEFRREFSFPGSADGRPFLYFCGNSLGLMPRRARDHVNDELDAWQASAVNAHFKHDNPWYSYHETVTRQLAHVVGAMTSEVVAMNSLTTNLHLLMASFYRPEGERRKVLIEKGAFPSDYYAVKSQLRFHGCDPAADLIEAAPRPGESFVRTEDILELIGKHGRQLALTMLCGVQYLSGQAFDLRRITSAAHAAGALAGYDLAHAAGNIDLRLHDDDVDFAAWCHYKYLNGGPGTIGGAFVHERHHRRGDLKRFEGWWGHDKTERFRMEPDFKAIPSVEAWQLSNPPILQLAALRASLELFERAQMQRLRAKSLRLTAYLEFLLDNVQGPAVEILTPRDPLQRGAQLSLRIAKGARDLMARLEERRVICDFREPDVIRVAPTPLYNSYSDVRAFVEFLKGTHA